MKNYALLLAILGMFSFVSCDEMTESEQDQQEEQTQEQVAQQQAESEDDVWTLNSEMMSGMGDESRTGTVIFMDDQKVRVKDDVVDITYTYEYHNEGAVIWLTNVEMEEDIIGFNITDESETSQTWENLSNDVKTVWTLTKE